MLNLNRSLERKVGIDSGGCGRCMIGSGNDAGSSGRGYGLFSKSGFTQRMLDQAEGRDDILLIQEDHIL